jgi:hypothetical protein
MGTDILANGSGEPEQPNKPVLLTGAARPQQTGRPLSGLAWIIHEGHEAVKTRRRAASRLPGGATIGV